MMNTKAQKQIEILPKSWIFAGALALLMFMCVLGIQGFLWVSEVDSEENGAIHQSRIANPDLRWAFDTWERCNQGAGSYAKDGYFAKEQCDLAVTALGDKRGASEEARKAIESLRANMIGASNRIAPPKWPLSLFF